MLRNIDRYTVLPVTLVAGFTLPIPACVVKYRVFGDRYLNAGIASPPEPSFALPPRSGIVQPCIRRNGEGLAVGVKPPETPVTFPAMTRVVERRILRNNYLDTA
jgi:hypothetical protein